MRFNSIRAVSQLFPIILVALLLTAGCSSFYYVVDGYYESHDIPGWTYDLIDGQSDFGPRNVPGMRSFNVAGDKDGRISIYSYIELPKGSSFEVVEANAFISVQGSQVRFPLVLELSKPTPAVFDHPPYPVSQTYRFEKIVVNAGTVYSGYTLVRPNAVVSKDVPEIIEMRGTVTIGHVDTFIFTLPELMIGGKSLPAFNATFKWNGSRKHVMKNFQ